jgi:hypothetical protein
VRQFEFDTMLQRFLRLAEVIGANDHQQLARTRFVAVP